MRYASTVPPILFGPLEPRSRLIQARIDGVAQWATMPPLESFLLPSRPEFCSRDCQPPSYAQYQSHYISPQSQQSCPSPISASPHHRPCSCQTQTPAETWKQHPERLGCLDYRYTRNGQQKLSSTAPAADPIPWCEKTHLCVTKILNPLTTCAKGTLLSFFHS